MSHSERSTMFEDTHNLQVMNEKVQSLANGVYKEFESVIVKFGGDAVKGLMPIVVNILESLDRNIKDKQRYEVDLELARVEVEHLRNQCDRERVLRKSADAKYLEAEDLVEEQRKQLAQLRNESESGIRRLEMRIKNLQDQASRMEDKESKLKDDYAKLHSKYSNLLKSHAEFVQKASESQGAIRTGSAKGRSEVDTEQKRCSNCSCDAVPSLPLPPKTEALNVLQVEPTRNGALSLVQDYSSSPKVSLLAEIAESQGTSNSLEDARSNNVANCSEQISDVQEDSDRVKNLEEENKTIGESSIEIEPPSSCTSRTETSDTGTERPCKIFLSFDALSQEGSMPDNSAVDEMFGECMIASNTFACKAILASSLSESHLFEIEDDSEAIDTPSQGVDDEPERNISLFEELSVLENDALGTDFAGVGAEVEKLIQENSELLATKNALNILKDDLIADVEELSGELELTREELASARDGRRKLESRLTELEDEVKKLREESAGLRQRLEAYEGKVDKTTFSRAELVRVLMERNQYKEKWMELQEAVRRAETLRASRAHPELAAAPEVKKGRTSIWGFFNSFIGRETDEG